MGTARPLYRIRLLQALEVNLLLTAAQFVHSAAAAPGVSRTAWAGPGPHNSPTDSGAA